MKDEWLEDWIPKLTSEEVPINPYRVIWDLQQAVDLENTIVTHDAGNPRDQTAPFWRALVPNSYIGWGKSTHLGYSLPLALGAKVAKPEKTVINIMGDAAFGMSGLEIATAARHQIGTLTIVLNNSCLGVTTNTFPSPPGFTKQDSCRGITVKLPRGWEPMPNGWSSRKRSSRRCIGP